MRIRAKIAAIELEGDEVRIVVVRTGGKAPVVLERHVCVAEYAGEEDRFEALVQAVQGAAERVKSHPSAYVLCADSRHSVVRSLTIPFRRRGRVAAAVQFELEPYLALPIDELVVDHSSIREIDGQTEVLAVGMRRDILEERIALLNAAGVDPEGIGIDATGLTALWLQGRSGMKGLSAVLHVQPRGSILCAVYERNLAFFRHLSVTPETLRENPAARAREVTNSLRAFLASWQGEDELAELTVTGVELDPDVREVFEEGIDVPVSYERPADRVRGTDKGRGTPKRSGPREEVLDDAPGEPFSTEGPPREETERAWDAAIGVAVSAAGGTVGLNFRRGDLSQPNAVRGMLLHGVFAGCLALLLLVSYVSYCYVDYRHNRAEIDRAGDEIWRLYSQSFPASPNVKADRPPQDVGGARSLAMMQVDYDDYQKTGRGFNSALLLRPTLLDILAELGDRLSSEKVLITDLMVRASRDMAQQVTISGELTERATGPQELQKLRDSATLEINGEPTVSQKPEKTTFVLTATTRHPGASGE